MTIDTEIRLSGNAAREFYNQMKSVDMTAITSRDAFLSDVNCRLDEHGILTIDINDLDIDLGVLEEADEKIEAIPAIKQEEAYTPEIDIRYLSWTIESKGTFSNDSVYCIDDYYASNSLYTINDNSSIRKAA